MFSVHLPEDKKNTADNVKFAGGRRKELHTNNKARDGVAFLYVFLKVRSCQAKHPTRADKRMGLFCHNTVEKVPVQIISLAKVFGVCLHNVEAKTAKYLETGVLVWTKVWIMFA